MGPSAGPIAPALDGVPPKVVPANGSGAGITKGPYKKEARVVVLNQDTT